MHRVVLLAAIVACLLPTAPSAVFAAQGPTDSPADPGLEVLIETGLAMPVGDLGAGFRGLYGGMGAEKGHRMGLRTRYVAENGLAIAPNLTFTEFGDYDGWGNVYDDPEGYLGVLSIKCTMIRYGLDVGWLAPGSADEIRPYVGAGAAIVKNTYKEIHVDDETFYEDAAHSLSWLLSVGVRWREGELALEYHGNRFDTSLFLPLAGETDYNWSYVALRLSYALPR